MVDPRLELVMKIGEAISYFSSLGHLGLIVPGVVTVWLPELDARGSSSLTFYKSKL